MSNSLKISKGHPNFNHGKPFLQPSLSYGRTGDTISRAEFYKAGGGCGSHKQLLPFAIEAGVNDPGLFFRK